MGHLFQARFGGYLETNPNRKKTSVQFSSRAAIFFGRDSVRQEIGVTGQCFRRNGSDPPIYAVHNVRLERKQLPGRLIAAGFRVFSFVVCPISGQVLNDEAAGRERLSG